MSYNYDFSSNNLIDDQWRRRSSRIDAKSAQNAAVQPQAVSKRDARSTILTRIAEDKLTQLYDKEKLKEKYFEDVISCADSDKKYVTLIHWAVVLPDFLDNEAKFDAAEVMIDILLIYKGKEINKVDKNADTGLHKVVSSGDHITRRLAKLICEGEAWRACVIKAVGMQNNNGENCIHLAIKNNIEIAEFLIKIAKVGVLAQRRNIKTGKDHINDRDGNTVLHDAVAYDRFVFNAPNCARIDASGNMCQNCREKYQAGQREMALKVRIVRSLVDKDNRILALKNGDDESPYNYFQQTKLKYHEKADQSTNKSKI